MSSFQFQLKDKHLHNILKDTTKKLLGDKTNSVNATVSSNYIQVLYSKKL